MRFLQWFYANGRRIGPPLIVAGAVLLGYSIHRIVRLEETSILFRLPLLKQQTVEFANSGPVLLWFEGPWLTSRFAGVTAELSLADGRQVKGHRGWFRSRSSGLTKARTGWLHFRIPEPGDYTLRLQGLEADTEERAGFSVVFARPHSAQTVGWILGILLSASLLIGSLVLFLLRVIPRSVVLQGADSSA